MKCADLARGWDQNKRQRKKNVLFSLKIRIKENQHICKENTAAVNSVGVDDPISSWYSNINILYGRGYTGYSFKIPANKHLSCDLPIMLLPTNHSVWAR